MADQATQLPDQATAKRSRSAALVVALTRRSFGLRRIRRLTRIILPGAAPGIVAAIRVGTGRAVVGMVVMELLLVSVGLGKLISRSRDRFDAPRLYAIVVSSAILFVGVGGAAVVFLIGRLERRVVA